jgi:hypothetical protein
VRSPPLQLRICVPTLPRTGLSAFLPQGVARAELDIEDVAAYIEAPVGAGGWLSGGSVTDGIVAFEGEREMWAPLNRGRRRLRTALALCALAVSNRMGWARSRQSRGRALFQI